MRELDVDEKRAMAMEETKCAREIEETKRALAAEETKRIVAAEETKRVFIQEQTTRVVSEGTVNIEREKTIQSLFRARNGSLTENELGGLRLLISECLKYVVRIDNGRRYE